jgi:hypothetical protein
MKLAKALLIGVVTLFGTLLLPTITLADDVYFDRAPPKPRVEEAPLPRAGYVWSPGYWDVRNNRHAWQQGHFERIRKGKRYEAPTWRKQDNRWALHYGRWNAPEGGSGNQASRVSAVNAR